MENLIKENGKIYKPHFQDPLFIRVWGTFNKDNETFTGTIKILRPNFRQSAKGVNGGMGAYTTLHGYQKDFKYINKSYSEIEKEIRADFSSKMGEDISIDCIF